MLDLRYSPWFRIYSSLTSWSRAMMFLISSTFQKLACFIIHPSYSVLFTSMQSWQAVLITSFGEVLFSEISFAVLFAIFSILFIKLICLIVPFPLFIFRYWLTAAWVIPILLATSTCDKPYLFTSSFAIKERNVGNIRRTATSHRSCKVHRLIITLLSLINLAIRSTL